jgi:hypothetical protein
MKKIYMRPAQSMIETEPDQMICGSIKSDRGIDYGGVDEEGSLDPSSRRYESWDDDNEEDI